MRSHAKKRGPEPILAFDKSRGARHPSDAAASAGQHEPHPQAGHEHLGEGAHIDDVVEPRPVACQQWSERIHFEADGWVTKPE